MLPVHVPSHLLKFLHGTSSLHRKIVSVDVVLRHVRTQLAKMVSEDDPSGLTEPRIHALDRPSKVTFGGGLGEYFVEVGGERVRVRAA
jgi:hypothetical protein